MAKAGKMTGAGWRERLPQGHRGSDALEPAPAANKLSDEDRVSLQWLLPPAGVGSRPGIVPQVGAGNSDAETVKDEGCALETGRKPGSHERLRQTQTLLRGRVLSLLLERNRSFFSQ